MEMPKALLDDRAVIAVSGLEARSFLQGLITNDVEKLAPDRALYAAILTPQGKILFDFILSEREGTLLVDCGRDSRDALAKRLTLYRLRSKVTIDTPDRFGVVAAWDGEVLEHAGSFADPRLADLGMRAIGLRVEMTSELLDDSEYQKRRLALGVPEDGDFGSDRMFALDGDLDELNGISFDKGCYVGQELTARMKHRGSARKRLLPVQSRGESLPAPGTAVTAGDREIGEIASVYGVRGFALLRLDRLAEAGTGSIAAGTVPITIERPNWLFS
jgi:folate-binding protein YgfZ